MPAGRAERGAGRSRRPARAPRRASRWRCRSRRRAARPRRAAGTTSSGRSRHPPGPGGLRRRRDLQRRGSAGFSASGSWSAITVAAPTRVSTCTEPGAASSNSCLAVPSGTTPTRAATAGARHRDDDADHDVELIADEDRRLVVDPVTLSRVAAFGPSTATRSPRVGVARVRDTGPAASVARTARYRPGDVAFTGSWNSVWP